MHAVRTLARGGLRLAEASEPPGPVRQLSFAPLLELSLRFGVAAPARLCVREGQAVRRGELLATADDVSSLPVHAPASGKLLRLLQRSDGAGGSEPRVLLAPFPGDTQEYAATRLPQAQATDPEALRSLLAGAGIVCRLEPARVQPLAQVLGELSRGAVLVLNGIELDPTFRFNGALLRQQAESIRRGLTAIRTMLAPAALLLAVESDDAEAARELLASGCGDPPPLLRVLPPRYPQADSRLLPGVLARGGGPLAQRLLSDSTCCLPLQALADTGELLASGEVVTSRLIAVAGAALREPGLYRVPLGTPLRHLLEAAGLRDEPVCVLQDGALRGRPLASLDQPVQHGPGGFLVLPADQVEQHEWPCLRCGECIEVCPVALNPAELGLLARRGEFAAMRDAQGLNECIECGCCTWVCPSRIPLLRRFRAASAQLQRLPSAVLVPTG